MPKSHPPYPPELRRRLIELVRAGRSPAEPAQAFEPSEQCIRNWAKQADRDAGMRQDGLTTAEKEELAKLRREVRTIREERAILARAAAWFARFGRSRPGPAAHPCPGIAPRPRSPPRARRRRQCRAPATLPTR